MGLIGRGLFVMSGIVVGSFLVNHLVFGNTGDALVRSERVGEWRKAEVRPTCYRALERPEDDPLAPRMPANARISSADFDRAREVTIALHCYVVTHLQAVCEPNNRAWIVDYIGKYYGKFDEMVGIAKVYGEAEIRNVQQLWNSQRNRAIEAALKDHIRTGRLKRSDFGWSLPSALQPAFEGLDRVSDHCSTVKKAER